MITVEQSVANNGAAPVTLRRFGLINRTNKTASIDSFNVHSGPIGGFDGVVTFATDYDDVAEAGSVANAGKTDWVGFTDIYWLSALIPDKARATSDFRSLGRGIYRADVLYDPVSVAPGQQLSGATRLFAGAKESDVLDRYEDGGIANFGLSIDWGWFRWFERPIFLLLNKIYELVGNFGLAIILLTVIVRGLMFPIAQRQFASMASMKAVQPKMKEIQERFKDDKQQQQQEIMALYKKEGVNPLAGCLPILLQIPVFFALYKVLILSVEMRHKPFALWIKDLSAQDPAHILNLFGLLPFTPPSFLAIGLLAVLLGVTMYLPVQAQSGADGSDAATGLRDHAVDDDVRHGAVRGGPADLLDHLEHPDDRAADLPLFPASADQGGGVTDDATHDVTDNAADGAALERARRLFAGPVEFLKSAPALKFLPDPDYPEVAFCGRSNVGKSSLLNALTGRKAIARTSVTPGRTQELNFFDVGEPAVLRLVDMPGYGYAKAPPKVVENWRRLVRDFLRGRQVLKRTLLLVDARHGVKPVDAEMMAMLDEAAVGYRIVLTKADKIKASELADVLVRTQAEGRKHPAAFPDVLVTSSEKGMGIAELRLAVLEDSEI